jgi:fatty acid desaturase
MLTSKQKIIVFIPLAMAIILIAFGASGAFIGIPSIGWIKLFTILLVFSAAFLFFWFAPTLKESIGEKHDEK